MPSELRQSGIYEIRCLVNGKVYIGSAVWIAKRWRHHREALRKGSHHSPTLQRAWNKYGEGAFEFSVLLLAPPERLIELEQAELDARRAAQPGQGFNVNPVAGSNLGRVFGPEFGEKIRKAKLGTKLTPEQCAAISERMKGNQHLRGHEHTAETLAKLRTARAGKKPALGMVHGPDARAAVSAAHKGKPLSDEHKRKISASHVGKKHSAEHTRNVARAQAKLTPEKVQQVRVLLAQGLSMQRIGQVVGCSAQTVCNIRHGTRIAYR